MRDISSSDLPSPGALSDRGTTKIGLLPRRIWPSSGALSDCGTTKIGLLPRRIRSSSGALSDCGTTKIELRPRRIQFGSRALSDRWTMKIELLPRNRSHSQKTRNGFGPVKLTVFGVCWRLLVLLPDCLRFLCFRDFRCFFLLTVCCENSDVIVWSV